MVISKKALPDLTLDDDCTTFLATHGVSLSSSRNLARMRNSLISTAGAGTDRGSISLENIPRVDLFPHVVYAAGDDGLGLRPEI